MLQFPVIKQRMLRNLDFYQDQFKSWNRALLSNVGFLKGLWYEVMETVVLKTKIEEIEENTVLFLAGDSPLLIFVLVSGEVETYV